MNLAFSAVVLYALNLLVVLLPGLAVTTLIARRRELSATRAVSLTVITSALLGYLAFWLYLANKLLGQIFSWTLLAASIVVLCVALRAPQIKLLLRSITPPFAYVFITGVCYLCFLFLFGGNQWSLGADLTELRFFSALRPVDDQLPVIFAERIYNRGPIDPLWGDWLSSDRPPLQAGIFLLQKPFSFLGSVGLHYELMGTALQCLWICGVWVLLTELRASPVRVKQVLGFLVFSGFMFYNSIYVWPKLFAATLLLFCLALLLCAITSGRQLSSFEVSLAALSLALALLAHPGSIFSLPVLVLIILFRKRSFAFRQGLIAALVIGVLVAPWIFYQRFYDPPGNRLLKMHLANAGLVDGRSFWQALKEAYTSQKPQTLLRYKWANVLTLIGPGPLAAFDVATPGGPGTSPFSRSGLERSRVIQREYIWSALGVLNAGWIALIVLLLMRNKQRALPYAALLLIVSITDLIVWSILMFGPGETFTTHSSYADILLLSLGLSGFLLTLPRLIVLALFGFQIFTFFVVWVLPRPANLSLGSAVAPSIQVPVLVVGLICAAWLAWHFGRSYLSRNKPEHWSKYKKIIVKILPTNPSNMEEAKRMIDPKLHQTSALAEDDFENVPEESLSAEQRAALLKRRRGLSINDTIAASANLSVGSRGVDTSGVISGAGAGSGMANLTPGARGESPAPQIMPGARSSGTTPRADSGLSDSPNPVSPSRPEATLSADEISARAYLCWHERGCPEGSPEVDWERAEQELRQECLNRKTSSASA